MTRKQADVCIVGAGFSGLACARNLLQLKPGLSIAVLEARNRVGGRSLSHFYKGHPVDIGGQWVGPQQPRVLQLAAEFGLVLERQQWFQETRGAGASHIESCASTNETCQLPEASCPMRNGTLTADTNGSNVGNFNSGSSALLSEAEQAELRAAAHKLESMAAAVLGPPWGRCEKAEAWDSISVMQFLKSNISLPGALREMELLVRTVMASEPDSLSLLYFLYYVRTCGGLAQLGDGDGGAQTFKFKDGSQQLCMLMADQLRKLGVKILLDSPVSSIALDEASGLYTVTFHGSQVTSQHVVVALPPTLWQTIDFQPPLPVAKQEIGRRMYMGSVVKTVAVYRDAFWDGATPSSQLEMQGPVANLFPAKVAGQPALVGLVTAAAAQAYRLLPEGARRDAVLQQYRLYFGTERALDCEQFASLDWVGERFSGGGFAALMPPGLATTHGDAQRLPHGGVHFAGVELARHWPGYFEGAIESGYRAAAEVCAKLGATSKL